MRWPEAVAASIAVTAVLWPGSLRAEPWEVGGGVRLYSRSLDFVDDPMATMSEYDLAAAPALVLRGEVRPGALLARPALPWLGLRSRIELTQTLRSESNTGSEHGTIAYELELGAIASARLGPAELGGGVSLGQHEFSLTGDATIPDVRYRYVRASASATLPLTPRLQSRLELGYRAITSAGQIASDAFFPRSSVGGVDASGSLEVVLTDGISASASVDISRYFYALNPRAGDRLIVGGAVDQFLSIAFAIIFRPLDPA